MENYCTQLFINDLSTNLLESLNLGFPEKPYLTPDWLYVSVLK